LFLAAAYNCNSDEALIEMNMKARALASSQERLLEMDELGKAFKSVTEAVWPIEIDELVYPIAIGFCANAEGIELNLTTCLYLQAYVSNLVSAAQRLMPLGQTEAQKIIKTLSPICLQVANETRDGNLDNIYSSVFISDIAAMKHETQVSRIFKT
jgi:urease accessory protein